MHALALDPAVETALRAGLALLFGAAALHKGRDAAAFRAALAAYGVLPAALVPLGAALVVAAEAAAVVALVAPGVGPVGAALGVPAWLSLPSRSLLFAAGPLLAAALLGLYGAAIAWNLARGRRDLDCGCLGPAARQPLSGWLVGRNALLVGAALACLLPGAPRALVWLDALSVACATALGALVWTGAHQALANRLASRGFAQGDALALSRGGGPARRTGRARALGAAELGHARPDVRGLGLR